MNDKFTPDYFIAKFSAIPDDKWTTRTFVNSKGQCCALGHLGFKMRGDDKCDYKEICAFNDLFNGNLFVGNVTCVNDGSHPLFQQPTPKARILAALQYIKEKSVLT